MKSAVKWILMVACASLTAGAGMASAAPPAGDSKPAAAATSAAAMSEGEIKKVDKGAGKLTIQHGELKNLDMPAMTMVFRVKDQAMLDQVKAGDQVRFVAEKINGRLVVTQIEAKK